MGRRQFPFSWQRARASRVSRALRAAFCVAVTASCVAVLCPAATLVHYPYLQNVRGDRATILWSTVERGAGNVFYSTDRTLSRAAPASVREFLPSQTGMRFPFYQYQAELTGLSAGTEYFYQVVVDGQNLTPEDELRFRTTGVETFRFLAFGDSGQDTFEQRSLAFRMLLENPIPNLVLHTGDIAYPNGSFSQFLERHFGVYFQLMMRVAFFPTPGNHEYESNNAEPYLALHAVPTEDVPAADRGRYYSFDWGNVHFISLDANVLLADPAAGTTRMLEWLENDLRKNQSFWQVAYFHHPPYASGPNESDPIEELARAKVVPVLERYRVPLVLNGHEHSYQRSFPLRNGVPTDAGTGTVYVTTGGGGASLYPVFPRSFLAASQSAHHYVRGEAQGMRMTLRAIRIDGREIDSVTLAPSPVISSDSVVNAASFTHSLAPGALVSIFGQHLAGGETMASRLPLPTELSSATVRLNGVPLPLLYVSPRQINVQLPFGMQGQALLRVTTPNGSFESPLTISDAAPGIFFVSSGSGALPTIIHASGALVSAQAPAESSETVSIYLTGLGAVNGDLEAGQPAPVSPLFQTRLPVRVELGNTLLTPSYAGLAPGFAGLYQVNVQIPSSLLSGTYPLTVIVGTGSRSNAASLMVRSAR